MLRQWEGSKLIFTDEQLSTKTKLTCEANLWKKISVKIVLSCINVVALGTITLESDMPDGEISLRTEFLLHGQPAMKYINTYMYIHRTIGLVEISRLIPYIQNKVA